MKRIKHILDEKGHDVWSVAPDDTVYEAVRVLAERQIGALLVMESGRLVGIVTERDYARKLILEGRSSRETLVRDVMTRRVLCVSADRTIEECMSLMTEQRARHLPVLDHKQVIGVISIGDLVKAIIDDQQTVIEELRQYISG
ncbi:MAG: CBS domain-containing protein [Gammaproteobacteria bacterium]|nr:CBS domain-containing protein [Gammaproteobacteria bacterium]